MDAVGEPARHQGESEVEYLQRCLAISKAITLTERLINKTTVVVGSFTPTIPPEVDICEYVVKAVSNLVGHFASIATTEKSGSISNPSSTHWFWNQVFNMLRKGRPGAEVSRVVYEWAITNPLEPLGRTNAIDFTFIPIARAHLNWLDYGGGLEAKINPPKSSGGEIMSSGTMTASGLKQALSRSAMCVYSRWQKNGWLGDHRAFCCFADANQFGIARVRLENNIVTAEQFGPIPLPGHNGSTDATALRFLAYVLSVPQDQLTELLSYPPSAEPDQLQGTFNGKNATWELGAYLGMGGFGKVYADLHEPLEVVKISDSNSLNTEASKLEKFLQLATLNDLIGTALPRLHTSLLSANDNVTKIAVRLSPRGVPISHYIRAIDQDLPIYSRLAQIVGVQLVSTLRRVHEVEVAHCDIRGSNVILHRPAGNEMAPIIRAAGVYDSECDAIREFVLDDCHVLLNDWGCAKCITTKNRNDLITNDLLMVVKMIQHFGRKVDVDVSQKPALLTRLIQPVGAPKIPDDQWSNMWNRDLIVRECRRIKNHCKIRHLDELIKLVHIAHLKMINALKVCSEVKSIMLPIPDFEQFIHKSYIDELARKLYKNTYLYEQGIAPLEKQRRNRELEILVRESLLAAIRESIPLDSLGGPAVMTKPTPHPPASETSGESPTEELVQQDGGYMVSAAATTALAE
eukprot:gene27493-33200_t